MAPSIVRLMCVLCAWFRCKLPRPHTTITLQFVFIIIYLILCFRFISFLVYFIYLLLFFFIFRLPRMYFVNCFYKFIGVKAFLTCCCCYCCCRLLEARILFMCVCVLNVVGALFWKRAKCETISLFSKFRLFLFSFANFAHVFFSLRFLYYYYDRCCCCHFCSKWHFRGGVQQLFK